MLKSSNLLELGHPDVLISLKLYNYTIILSSKLYNKKLGHALHCSIGSYVSNSVMHDQVGYDK
jgi:hypothetical protein